MSKGHIKFPSIGSFANMIKFRDRFRSKTETATFGTKIKLHGTNAGVRIRDGEIKVQSRGRDISVGKDNYGFANWVDLHKSHFEIARRLSVTTTNTIIIYGEWAGEGVQKSVAVSKAPKAFYVFAICIMAAGGSKRYIVEPSVIEQYVPAAEGLYILPWFKEPVKVDFGNSFNTPEVVATYLNEEVAKIDEVDPYIKDLYGIEAVGEGLVGYCLDELEESGWWFKVKGSKHTVNDEAKIAKVQRRAGQEYHDLAEAFLTEGRFNQAIFEKNLDFDKKNTGPFLSWVMQDIQKESSNEREELQIEWRLWAGILSKGAREWFLAKCDAV